MARPDGWLILSATLLCAASAMAQRDGKRWWSDAAQKSVELAGDNGPGIIAALRRVPTDQRDAMAFLVSHMPRRDLQRMETTFLLENVALAHAAIARVPWGKDVPRDVFWNDVLPFANITETRERWRKDFYARFLPLVKDCKTPGEAAQVLNRKIFGILGVRYSTKRRRADQSPSESIDTGMASCTGLSILLTDACRAVGIPARLAGIPRWVNKRGNHTWVEVWDDGAWHFTGAAEPSKHGLDHGWFARDAALAKKDSPRHSIYAVSFRPTDVEFPMVWARGDKTVHAINVTDRYTKPEDSGVTGRTRLMIRVREHARGPRIVADVTVVDKSDARRVLVGASKGERKDTNDFLTFDVDAGRAYEIRVRVANLAQTVEIPPTRTKQKLIDVALLSDADVAFKKAATAWFVATPDERRAWRFDKAVDAAIRDDDTRARQLTWIALRAAPIHARLQQDLAANQVRSGEHVSPYKVRKVGTRPARGWPLFIAMHGGGRVRTAVNDRQWRVMERYYRDQADVPGYLYLALRAPNDEWNGFYTHYVWPLITRLIRQFVVCGDVDPSKVFLMGYSHGGYGAFAIGTNIPHRFAAIHSSAAAPTPGISPAKNLRNTIFTYMIGERDHRYGRLKRCRAFDAEVRALRGTRKDIFPVTMEFQPGHGHSGLPDRDKIRGMFPAMRQPVPRHITWRATGPRVHDFFWVSLPEPKGGEEIEATCRDNRVTLKTSKVASLVVGLDARLVDFSRPVQLEFGGEIEEQKLRPSMKTLCESMLTRGDPALAYTAKIELTAGN